MVCNLPHESLASSSSNVSALWNSIWKANVPDKVRVHIWKVCASFLPTVDNVRRRCVLVGEGCCFCDNGDESIEHISARIVSL